MAFPVDYTRAKQMADRLTEYYQDPELIFLPREYDGWFLFVTKPELSGGILMHVNDVDNGAAGFREEALRRINALRDGVAYEAPLPKGLIYDDVITTRML